MPLLSTGRGRPRGRRGRGRGSKVDSRQAGEEGLVTLTSLILSNAEVRYFATVLSILYTKNFLHLIKDYQYVSYLIFLQPQNFKIKKDISIGKKGSAPAEPQRPVSDLSPSKKIKEPQMDNTPHSPPAGTSKLQPPSDERKEEQKIKAEVIPDLCGMRSVRDITKL